MEALEELKPTESAGYDVAGEIIDQIKQLKHKLKIEQKGLLAGVGLAIKEGRVNAGLTQQDLADLTTMGRTQITNIEKGNSGLTLVGFTLACKALNLSADELLGIRS